MVCHYSYTYTVSSMGQKEVEVSLISPVMNMKSRKVMKGHRGRVLHFDWSPDLRKLISAGQVRIFTF